ncbi:MAG: hypothetical protein RR911_03490 [Oscillospiraceae bacterium]
MKFETNYPYVLIHGMFGFGQGEKLNDILPYWGMLTGDLTTYLNGEGFETYNPSISPISSAWDRACEIYAQLVGGTVDYGKAHSEKYGHKRFGRTYSKPIFEGWGKDKKVNLVGHSFGGSTIRIFATLMADGSKEEMAVTEQEDISPFFTGGKANWVHSITAFACVHEGTTLMYSMQNLLQWLEKVTTAAANMAGGSFSKLYEFHAEQWDLNGFENGHSTKALTNKERQHAMIASTDNVYYDLTLHGSKEINEKITCVEDVYYFSCPCRVTSQQFFTSKPKETPLFRSCPVFIPFARSIGKYSKNTINDIPVDESWLPNDGLVPTISERAPFNEPHMDFHDAKGKYKSGMWYVYDDFVMDHLGIIGGLLPTTNTATIRKIYRDHFRMINNLKK